MRFNECRCYDMLRKMRWPNGIICPFCGQPRVTTHSKSTGNSRRRYLCLSCRRTFSDLTGTPMARTNLSLEKWFQSLLLIGEGLCTSELAKEIGVKWDTAAHMQRIVGMALGRPSFFWSLREALKENPHG